MNKQKKKQYTKIKHFFMIFDLAYTVLLFSIILFAGLTFTFKNIAFNISENFYLQILLYSLVTGLFLYALNLPIDFISGFIIEHKYNLSNQTFFAWIKDNIKKAVVSAVIFTPLVLALYFCLKNFPNFWWLIISLIFIIFSIVLGKVAPVLIIPLFYKYKDIENDDLKNKIFNLSKRTGIKIKDIFEIDFSRETKKANAALTGLGNTRRVLLTDNLINNFTYDEIESVLAHELGHHKHNHIIKQLIIGSIITIIGFYLCNIVYTKTLSMFGISSIHDVAGMPLIGFIFFIFSLIIMPAQNIYSRALERQADKYAIDNIELKDAFKSALQKLADINLADEEPNKIIEFLFYSHPSIKKRIKNL